MISLAAIVVLKLDEILLSAESRVSFRITGEVAHYVTLLHDAIGD